LDRYHGYYNHLVLQTADRLLVTKLVDASAVNDDAKHSSWFSKLELCDMLVVNLPAQSGNDVKQDVKRTAA